MWAGLAKLAGGPVYGGVSDASYPPETLYATLPGDVLIVDTGLDELRTTLMEMAEAVYKDISWQFRAHEASGLYALRHAAEGQNGIEVINLPVWEALDMATASKIPLIFPA